MSSRSRSRSDIKASHVSSSSSDYLTPSSSEDESHSCLSDDDGNNGSDLDSGLESDQHVGRTIVLPDGHRIQSQRSNLASFSYKNLKRWIVDVHYSAPSQKRSRMSRWQSGSPCCEDDGDCSEAGFVVLPHQGQRQGFFRLACPFYVSNPSKYRQCLLQFDSDSIEGLIDHLGRQHERPSYCPICYETFETIILRDDHILKRVCKLESPRVIDGIGEQQKLKLWKRDKWYLDESKRWNRIWAVVFPNTNFPRSPYLSDDCGLAVSMARDFWDARGQRCVLKFLKTQNVLEKDHEKDEEDLELLYKVGMNDLLEKVLKEQSALV